MPIPKGAKRTGLKWKERMGLPIDYKSIILYKNNIFRKVPSRFFVNQNDPFDFRVASEEEYLADWRNPSYVKSVTLEPLPGAPDPLTLVNESELKQLKENTKFLEILLRLGIQDWEHFDTALADLEKEKNDEDN